MPFHVSYGVACGERTVAACCEIKTGLERGSLVNFGLRGTRNAVAPPLGTLESEARILGPKSSHESGTVCLAPQCSAAKALWSSRADRETKMKQTEDGQRRP